MNTAKERTSFSEAAAREEKTKKERERERERKRDEVVWRERKRRKRGAGWEPSRFRFYPVRPDRAPARIVLGGMRVRWSRPMLTQPNTQLTQPQISRLFLARFSDRWKPHRSVLVSTRSCYITRTDRIGSSGEPTTHVQPWLLTSA